MVTLTLTPAQLQIILDGLSELPFKKAAPLVGVLQQQYLQHHIPTKVAEPEPPAETVE